MNFLSLHIILYYKRALNMQEFTALQTHNIENCTLSRSRLAVSLKIRVNLLFIKFKGKTI